MNTDQLLKIPFTWVNKGQILKLLPHKTSVMFALFCAHQVKHLIPKEHQEVCLKAIEVAELFLEGNSTKEECVKAADAAISAAYDADAAYAAYAADAAYASAYAAYAAYDAAAYASYAAAYAANAANAAFYNNQETIKQEQMNYLRDLIIVELPEEDKSCCCWLLVASL